MDTHYVCPSCGGSSTSPKECDTEGCRLHAVALVECHCADGRHEAILSIKDQPITE